VSQVRTHADLELVQQVRFCVSELPLSITCDVDPILLMLESDEAVQAYAKASVGPAPTLQDVQAMWTMLSAIDCFATGARQAELALTVVMGAVAAERLTVDQVVERMHRNPLRVLGVSAVRGSQVEMARTSGIALEGAVRTGAKVERLSVRGETMVSNGVVIAGQLAALDCHSLAYRNSGTEDELTNESATSVPRKSPSHVRIRLGSSTSSALDGSISMLSSSSTAAAAAGALGSSATALSSSGAAAVAMASASDLTEASASLPQRHMLTVKGITRGNLHALFRSASEMRTMFERQGTVDFLKNRILATLFYEPSTRTQCSFVAAMQRLGGQCIDVSPSTSSIQKGESLADTVRCVECYADAIVVRHPTPGSVQEAAKHASVPVINGGDGIGEHPTQALLDLFTIREELGTVNGLTVTFVGDLLNGRTCHSLVQLLLLYHVKLNFVSHASLCMPDDVQAAVDASGVTSTRTERLTDVLAQTDVLYVTRVQKERFASEEEYNRVRDVFKITPAVLQGAKQKCIVMHPLPRVDEISPEVDYDPRAVYFRQMKYGLYVRAALLYAMLGGPNKLDF
jgi:carbamoyl-phosphate synthase/aspartate carbamoyltransferase